MKRIRRAYSRTVSLIGETAVQIYENYIGGQKGFLLESYDKNNGRYVFMGKNPEEIIHTEGDCLVIRRANGDVLRLDGNPVDRLKAYCDEFVIRKNDESLVFTGGLVGALGYDFVRYGEELPDENPDEIGIDTIQLMLVTESLTIDHLAETMTAVVIEEDNPGGEERAIKKCSIMLEEALQGPDQEKESKNKIRPDGLILKQSDTLEEYSEKVKKTLKVSIASKRIHLGKTRKLKVSSGSKKYKFISSNKKIATVNSKGVVSAKKLGKVTITVKALADNNYYASEPRKITLEMVKTKISNGSFHVKLSKKVYTYNGNAKKPAVTLTSDAGLTLKKGRDFKVTYKNNKNAGKATVVVKGINNYGGTLKQKFTINKATQTITARVSPATIRVGGNTKVKVKKKAGTPQFKSTQSSVASVDSHGKVTGKNIGSTTIKVVVPESRNYKKATAKVVVKVRRAKFSEANIKVNFSTRYYTYNGEGKYPSPKVYDGSIRMYEGSDYTVSYKDNVAIGSARIIIKGINNYSGSLTKYFFIVPAETKFRSVRNSASGTIACTWIARSNITGYQIQYAENYQFNNAVLRLVRDPDATSFNITGLDTGVYFVRIRPYKYIPGDDTYVSAWSVPVKITVSK